MQSQKLLLQTVCVVILLLGTNFRTFSEEKISPPPSANQLKSFSENSWEKYAMNIGGKYTDHPDEYAGNLVRIGVDKVQYGLKTLEGKPIDGSDVIVGIIDTGISDFYPKKEQMVAFKDFTLTSSNPTDSSNIDEENPPHGSHVIGTILGDSVIDKNGTKRRIGIAPKAKFVIAKILSSSKMRRGPYFTPNTSQTVAHIYAALKWMVYELPENQRPQVINCSLVGAHNLVTILKPTDPQFVSLFKDVNDKGIVVVFSAGNTHIEQRPYEGLDEIKMMPNIISVAATDVFDYVTNFSSRGIEFSYGYPYIKPDIAAPGQDIPSYRPNGEYANNWPGTSMAAPHVTGIVALMKQVYPKITPFQVMQIIESTAEHIEPEPPTEEIKNHPFFKEFYKRFDGKVFLFDVDKKGAIDFSTKNRAYGSGIISAYRAVKETIGLATNQGTFKDEKKPSDVLKKAESYLNNRNHYLAYTLIDRILNKQYDNEFKNEQEKNELYKQAYLLKIQGYRSSYSFKEVYQTLDDLLLQKEKLKIIQEETCELLYLKASCLNDEFLFKKELQYRPDRNDELYSYESLTDTILNAYTLYTDECPRSDQFHKSLVQIARYHSYRRENKEESIEILLRVIAAKPGTADSNLAFDVLMSIYPFDNPKFIDLLDNLYESRLCILPPLMDQIIQLVFQIIENSYDITTSKAAWKLYLKILESSHQKDTLIQMAVKAFRSDGCVIKETIYEFLTKTVDPYTLNDLKTHLH